MWTAITYLWDIHSLPNVQKTHEKIESEQALGLHVVAVLKHAYKLLQHFFCWEVESMSPSLGPGLYDYLTTRWLWNWCCPPFLRPRWESSISLFPWNIHPGTQSPCCKEAQAACGETYVGRLPVLSPTELLENSQDVSGPSWKVDSLSPSLGSPSWLSMKQSSFLHQAMFKLQIREENKRLLLL